ncbi:MAG TPA: YggT family protein [Candidatus Dormibacteraeota bacterium]|nr:YggT family protein [Candidatus Dormibacteraeota bacterium]
MNALLCQIDRLANFLVLIYTGVLIVYAVISWIPDLRGKWTEYLAMLVEPVLQPIRRVIPPIGGLDIAFLVLLVLLQIVIRPALSQIAYNTCYRLF